MKKALSNLSGLMRTHIAGFIGGKRSYGIERKTHTIFTAHVLYNTIY